MVCAAMTSEYVPCALWGTKHEHTSSRGAIKCGRNEQRRSCCFIGIAADDRPSWRHASPWQQQSCVEGVRTPQPSCTPGIPSYCCCCCYCWLSAFVASHQLRAVMWPAPCSGAARHSQQPLEPVSSLTQLLLGESRVRKFGQQVTNELDVAAIGPSACAISGFTHQDKVNRIGILIDIIQLDDVGVAAKVVHDFNLQVVHAHVYVLLCS